MDTKEYNHSLQSFFDRVPQIDLAYIKGLTNKTGIYQHAKFNIPDYRHGYCLDDNTRALLLTLMISEEELAPLDENLVRTYLSYIYYSQNEDGLFKNFLSYDLKFLESIGSEDSMGRTIWTLGYLLAHEKFSKYHIAGKEIFDRIIGHAESFTSIRAVAYSIIGILYYLEKYPNHTPQIDQLNLLLDFLIKEYQAASSLDWPWFEEILTYDNAVIPLSVLKAARFLNNDYYQEVGVESSIFLDRMLFNKEHLSLIGNNGWLTKNNQHDNNGQQPIEISSIILWYKELANHSLDLDIEERIKLAFCWFLGLNDHKQSLFDFENMACFDGLEPYGPNKNMGAESNISFWMSYVQVKNFYR